MLIFFNLLTQKRDVIFMIFLSFHHIAHPLCKDGHLVWILYAYRQRSNFGNFKQFFHHSFRLKWKFIFLMVSSERSSSDLSEYILFQPNLFFIYKNQFQSEKLQFFFCSFFSKYSNIYIYIFRLYLTIVFISYNSAPYIRSL